MSRWKENKNGENGRTNVARTSVPDENQPLDDDAGGDGDGDGDGDGGGGLVFSGGVAGTLSSVVHVTSVGEVDVNAVPL